MEWGVVEIAGWSGAVVCLLAYAMVSAGRLSGKSITFALMNVFGSAMLAWNGYAHQALPAVFVNGMWMLIGVISFAAHHGPWSAGGPPAPE